MALFGGRRDISLFTSINRELVGNIIDTEVDIFQISLTETVDNIYGEALEKVFYRPVRLPCVIQHDKTQTTVENDTVDIERTAGFRFVRQMLAETHLYLMSGDIIHWDNNYYEVDKIEDTQYYMKRNPETAKRLGGYYGTSTSVVAICHMTKRDILNIENLRTGRREVYAK